MDLLPLTRSLAYALAELVAFHLMFALSATSIHVTDVRYGRDSSLSRPFQSAVYNDMIIRYIHVCADTRIEFIAAAAASAVAAHAYVHTSEPACAQAGRFTSPF